MSIQRRFGIPEGALKAMVGGRSRTWIWQSQNGFIEVILSKTETFSNIDRNRQFAFPSRDVDSKVAENSS
jgi:hypothetical protein